MSGAGGQRLAPGDEPSKEESLGDTMLRVSVRTGVCAMAALLFQGTFPLRATADDSTAVQGASPAELQEVTVTATRREESAAKVPIEHECADRG